MRNLFGIVALALLTGCGSLEVVWECECTVACSSGLTARAEAGSVCAADEQTAIDYGTKHCKLSCAEAAVQAQCTPTRKLCGA